MSVVDMICELIWGGCIMRARQWILIHLIIYKRISSDLYFVQVQVNSAETGWYRNAVARWLLAGCVLIMAMVVIGGITRLTHSGLSMVKWNIFGSAPPLTDAKWDLLFAQYKESPEYRLVNSGYTIEDFKNIFWWEFIHRFLGRTIGLVFIVPFVWFIARKKFTPPVLRRLLVILGLGMLQGIFGWIMVKSGLNTVPHVSHYLLALHLATAFTTFGLTFWLFLTVITPVQQRSALSTASRRWLLTLFTLIGVQIIYGAFVAGLKAGWYYPQFPMMGDYWIPPEAFSESPFWKNLLANGVAVQFIHRLLGTLIVCNVIAFVWSVRKASLTAAYRTAIVLLCTAVTIQFTLGVATLLWHVPVALASAHQAVAFLLFGVMLYLLHNRKQASEGHDRIEQDTDARAIRCQDKAQTYACSVALSSAKSDSVPHSKSKQQPGDAKYKKHVFEFDVKLPLAAYNKYDLN